MIPDCVSHIVSSFLLILKNTMLVYSICQFNIFIKAIDFASANERLMTVHFINVFVYTVIYITDLVLYVYFVKYRESDGPQT